MIEQLTEETEIVRCDKCFVPGGVAMFERGTRTYSKNMERAQLLFKLVSAHGWVWAKTDYTAHCKDCARKKK